MLEPCRRIIRYIQLSYLRTARITIKRAFDLRSLPPREHEGVVSTDPQHWKLQALCV